MPLPKHNLLKNNENPLWADMEQKQLGFSPLVMCEFFEGMDVLQIYGHESKEYIFALYFNEKLCGHCYFGTVYTEKQIQNIKARFFPPTWNQIFEYVKNTSGVWYSKFDQSQYAFVMEKVVQKIE